MTKRLTIALVALALFVLVAVLPVSADYSSNQLYYVVNTNISQGATVYIGEQGLNVTPAVYTVDGRNFANTTIGWWASAAALTTAPSVTYNLQPVLNASTFQVPNSWNAYTGPWYLMWPNNTAIQPSVFTVADPQLDVEVYDPVNQIDDNGQSVVQGQNLSFQVTTNLYSALASTRTGALGTTAITLGTGSGTGGYMDIRVKTPSGTTLSSLLNGNVNAGGTYQTMTAMNVSTPTWIWGEVPGTATIGGGNWSTGALDVNGQQAYPAGTYTVWAQSKLNNMLTNYPNAGASYTSKTISPTYTVTLVSNTVSIQANVDTVVRSKPFSVTVTGEPNTIYRLWISGTNSMSGAYNSQPPMILGGQSNVKQDYNMTANDDFGANSYATSGNGATDEQAYIKAEDNSFNTVAGTISALGYIYQNGGGNHVYNDVAMDNYTLWGTLEAANVTTSATTGTETVQISTTNWTKAQQYTVRVEQNFGTDTASNANYKSDTVDVSVQEGAVTVTAAGSQSYYLGEQIDLSGTNTESSNTYLFIVGPNLPTYGGELTSPHTAVQNTVASSFVVASVAGDNTWSYQWGTNNIDLDAGTYTIYAVSNPNDDNTANGDLNDVAYGTVSVIIKKPFISATASESTVAQGDDLYITGTAQGNPQPGIALWIVGNNYVYYNTQAVNSDASFSYELQTSDTKNLAPGQYFVVAQTPMQSKTFTILPSLSNNADPAIPTQYTALPSTGILTGSRDVYVWNAASAVSEFQIYGNNALQGSDAAEALVTALDDPNVPDTYTKLQFTVEVPYININPIGDHAVGDKFTVTAATNLAVGDNVLVQIYSSSFKPTAKSQSGEFSGATGTEQVTAGTTGANVVSFPVDTSTFKPDEYIVEMDGVLQTATGTALFNVLESTPTTAVPTAAVTTVAPTVVATPVQMQTTVAPTPVPTTTKSPGFGALIALTGLGAVAFVIVRRH